MEVPSSFAKNGDAPFGSPSEISGTGASGSTSFDVRFGYRGSYAAGAHGLVPATVTSDTVQQDANQSFSPGDVATGGAKLHQFNLSGAAHFRVAMPPESTESGADLDLYVYSPANVLVASSTAAGTNEIIDVPAPADGTWKVYVHGFTTPGGDSDYDMWTWAVPNASGGTLSIGSAPTSAAIGTVGSVNVQWSGLGSGSPADWYLGAVSHTGDSGLIGRTLIGVDNR